MTSEHSRGPYAKGIEKRERVLTEALLAYAGSGASGPSLRTIAQRVGLSERGLLHYFSSRAELFVAILAERDARLRAGVTCSDSLLAAVQSQLDTPGLARLFLELAAASPDESHPAHAFFTRHYAQLLPLVQSIIGDTDDAWSARMLVAAADGLQIQWLLDPTIDPRADLERLWTAIRAV